MYMYYYYYCYYCFAISSYNNLIFLVMTILFCLPSCFLFFLLLLVIYKQSSHSLLANLAKGDHFALGHSSCSVSVKFLHFNLFENCVWQLVLYQRLLLFLKMEIF